jgi:hypothetical protein
MPFKVSANLTTPDWLPNRAAEMTTHGQPVRAPLAAWYRSQHSPIRARWFWVEIECLPTFVSVHLVRHHVGIDHFVQSMRDDRGGGDAIQITRLTPVRHGLHINADALINVSRKRLCYQAHVSTVGAWRRVLRAIAEVDPELPKYCVPECVYRGGICPEFRQCKPGIEKVIRAYRGYRDNFKHTTSPEVSNENAS